MTKVGPWFGAPWCGVAWCSLVAHGAAVCGGGGAAAVY